MVFRAARAFTVSRCGITSSLGSSAPTVVSADATQPQQPVAEEPVSTSDLAAHRRRCVEQLVAEAARRDWRELTSQYQERVIYAPVTVCGSANRTNVDVPVDVRHLHRKYWEHIMQDSVSYFDAVVADRTTPPASPVSDGDPPVAIAVSPQVLRDAQQAAFLMVMDRLSRRNLWRSPVTESVATKQFSKLKEETQSISQPHHEMWKRQKAQKRVLRHIPPGQYFLPDASSTGPVSPPLQAPMVLEHSNS